MTPGRFTGYRILAAVGLPLIWLWFSASTGMSPFGTLFGMVASGALGWWVPSQFVKDRATKEPFPPEQMLAGKIAEAALDRGLIT